MRENRHVYHYCAHYQLSAGVVNYVDVIALMTRSVKSMDDYTELKKAISEDNYERLTIDSLSFLGIE